MATCIPSKLTIWNYCVFLAEERERETKREGFSSSNSINWTVFGWKEIIILIDQFQNPESYIRYQKYSHRAA